jgi:hypothetical protein
VVDAPVSIKNFVVGVMETWSRANAPPPLWTPVPTPETEAEAAGQKAGQYMAILQAVGEMFQGIQLIGASLAGMGIGGGVTITGGGAVAGVPAIAVSVVGVGVGTGEIGHGIWVIQNAAGASAPKPTRPGTGSGLPVEGKPNTASVAEDGFGNGTIREYGVNGKARVDYDFGHNHGAGDPHAHDWNWSGPKPVRGPGRPLRQGE